MASDPSYMNYRDVHVHYPGSVRTNLCIRGCEANFTLGGQAVTHLVKSCKLKNLVICQLAQDNAQQAAE
ncbi:hypothetical protein Pelo_2901 [Pelomyxa schiedti]|nr:hypothetical protein Pelo_2901 [Pelomyxa schiedti]